MLNKLLRLQLRWKWFRQGGTLNQQDWSVLKSLESGGGK